MTRAGEVDQRRAGPVAFFLAFAAVGVVFQVARNALAMLSIFYFPDGTAAQVLAVAMVGVFLLAVAMAFVLSWVSKDDDLDLTAEADFLYGITGLTNRGLAKVGPAGAVYYLTFTAMAGYAAGRIADDRWWAAGVFVVLAGYAILMDLWIGPGLVRAAQPALPD
jgi:hypothetical protein